MKNIKKWESFPGWGDNTNNEHQDNKNNFESPLYKVGDVVEIFYIYENELFEIEDVIFEKGIEPAYNCKLISKNAGDLLDDEGVSEGDIIYIEENEILRKVENSSESNFNNKNGLLYVLQDENDDMKSYCFRIKMIDYDEFDEFCDTAEFEEFMDKMETSIAHNDLSKWAGVHDCTGGEKWVGYHSYEIKDFDAAIRKWYKFFSIHNKLSLDSTIFVVDDNDLTKFDRGTITYDELLEKSNNSQSNVNKIDLSGREFVFTGFRDPELKNFIESCGGVVKDSITKKTTDLLTKDFDSNSSKAKKAKEIGAKVTQVDVFKGSLK